MVGLQSTSSARRRLFRAVQQLRPAAAAVTTLQVSTTPPSELLPPPTAHPTPAQLRSFDRDGFLVVDDMVDPCDLPPLLAESRRIVAGVRDSSLPRGDPKQTGLPPHTDPAATWAIRGLLSPHLASPVYSDYLCSEPVRRYTRGFLRQPEERWMMGDCLIFTSPNVPAVPGIGWHRDIQVGAAGYRQPDGKASDDSEQAERRRWQYAQEAHAAHVAGAPRLVIAWHLALVTSTQQ